MRAILQDPEAAGAALLSAERDPIPTHCGTGECLDEAFAFQIADIRIGGSI